MNLEKIFTYVLVVLFASASFASFAQEIAEASITSTEQIFASADVLTTEKSVTICNGDEQFVTLGVPIKNIDGYFPKSGILRFEENGVWLNPNTNTLYTFNHSHGTIVLDATVERVNAQFSVTPNSGTAPLSVAVTNESENAIRFKWDVGVEVSEQIEPTFNFSEPGSYPISLTVIGEKGCSSVSTGTVVEVFEEGEFFIPNAFTPNFDGRNETFFVIPKNIQEFTCSVFNQYGDLVTSFSTRDEEWDGTFNGYPAPSGSYIYKIRYTNLAGHSKKLVGAVELRR